MWELGGTAGAVQWVTECGEDEQLGKAGATWAGIAAGGLCGGPEAFRMPGQASGG
jgi:hypothetical protein